MVDYNQYECYRCSKITFYIRVDDRSYCQACSQVTVVQREIAIRTMAWWSQNHPEPNVSVLGAGENIYTPNDIFVRYFFNEELITKMLNSMIEQHGIKQFTQAFGAKELITIKSVNE